MGLPASKERDQMKRIISLRSDAVPVSHPDGGVLHIEPMTFEEAREFQRLSFPTIIERDDRGTIIYNNKTGEPVRRYDSERATEAQLDLACRKVVRIDEIEYEDGTRFEQTPENIRRVLTLIGTSDVEIEVELDQDGKEFTGAEGQRRGGKSGKVTRSVRENYYLWALRKSADLARERNERERKNS